MARTSKARQQRRKAMHEAEQARRKGFGSTGLADGYRPSLHTHGLLEKAHTLGAHLPFPHVRPEHKAKGLSKRHATDGFTPDRVTVALAVGKHAIRALSDKK